MIPALKDQHSKFDLGAIKTVPRAAAAVAAVLMYIQVRVDVAVIESAPARDTTSRGVQAPWMARWPQWPARRRLPATRAGHPRPVCTPGRRLSRPATLRQPLRPGLGVTGAGLGHAWRAALRSPGR
jgi:hypothetical protein